MSTINNKDNQGRDEAVDLIRDRINQLYSHYSEQADEPHSLIDRFWHRHQEHPDPHSAWYNYYQELTEDEKKRLWEEYHLKTGPLSGVPEVDDSIISIGSVPEIDQTPEVKKHPKIETKPRKAKVTAKRIKAAKKLQSASRAKRFYVNHVWPLISSAMIVGFIWLVFNNELIIARVQQYVTPNQAVNSPVAIDPSTKVGKDPKIIIPKFNIDLPVVYNIKTLNEDAIQAGLEKGVVHYGNTALPGEVGNNVIVGHSSNNFFNRGTYKYAFVLIGKLEKDDTVILNYKGVRYTYRVFNKQVIDPTDFSLVQPTKKPIVTLITCDPPGTSWRRMVIQAEQISPDPSTAEKVNKKAVETTEDIVVPGNAPSLWDTIREAIF